MLKTFSTILLILAGLVGFIFSYEFAYRKIARVLDQPSEKTEVTSWASSK